jgi:hypothetical protein
VGHASRAGPAHARARTGPCRAATVDDVGRGMAILGRVTNRAASVLRASAVAGTILLASGCASAFSPIQTDYDYDAADGVPLTIEGLDLRDLAIVVPAKGGTGTVIGQAVNRSTSAVDVTFSVAGAPAPASVAVPASSGKTLSDAVTGVEIPGIPVAPGEMVELTVTTPEAGDNVVMVPVLVNKGYYSDLDASSS